MKKLDHFIRVYDGVLTSVCEYLTLSYEMSQHKESIENEKMDLTQLNVNQHPHTLVPNLLAETRKVIKVSR